jgi:hypothetical protein
MINIEDKRFYRYDDNDEMRLITKNRLKAMSDLGMEELYVANFGIRNVVSGLYIEKVWHYSDEEFEDYLTFVKEVKNNTFRKI